MDLETDESGIVTFQPLLRWGVSVVQDKTVGLIVDYYASADDAAAGKSSRLQLHMEPAAAKELARVLGVRADIVLGGGPKIQFR